MFKISLAQWSLHRTIFAGELHPLDFPRAAREQFGLGAVEYVNRCFKDHYADDDLSYLPELLKRTDDLGVRNLLIMIDGQGHLGDPDDEARTTAVENHYKWVEAARFLGCHSIRVNAASHGSPEEQKKLVVDGLSRLAEFGGRHEIDIIVENHGGLSSNGAWLADVIRTVNHPHCGTLPDFGNFQVSDNEWYDVYQGVEEMMPYAQAVSAKSYEFDDDHPLVTHRDREGMDPLEIDYLKMMKIVTDAGYLGYVGIEYEGHDLDEMEGIRRTKTMLEQAREQLSA